MYMELPMPCHAAGVLGCMQYRSEAATVTSRRHIGPL